MDRPENVIWDTTYACPLRCIHCYSESGRRASQQLNRDALFQITDAIISLRPRSVALAGGEPLLVREVFEIAARLTQAGIAAILYTSGWSLRPDLADRIMSVFHQVVVSVDGATPEVHDRIRQRNGSFDRAMSALDLLDAATVRSRESGRQPARLSVEYVVTRSNLHQLEQVCTDIAPRFPSLRFLSFGAVVPSGLASRISFTDQELLTDAEADVVGSRDRMARLQSLAPATVRVSTSDNRNLQMRPDQISRGDFASLLQIEPDGAVRAMPIYEGTVGNLRTEPAELLWKRAVARWHDPFVQQTLAAVHSMADWAEATRRIDLRFGSAAVRARIDRRPEL
ncbi:radical SAM protein [Micromonospora sp. NPDC003197]